MALRRRMTETGGMWDGVGHSLSRTNQHLPEGYSSVFAGGASANQ